MADDVVVVAVDDQTVRHLLSILFEAEGFRVRHVLKPDPHRGDCRGCTPAFVILDATPRDKDHAAAASFVRGAVPSARVVAFAIDLDAKPHWADAYLNRDRLVDVAPLLATLPELRAS